jgi:hypothetical protein
MHANGIFTYTHTNASSSFFVCIFRDMQHGPRQPERCQALDFDRHVLAGE